MDKKKKPVVPVKEKADNRDVISLMSTDTPVAVYAKAKGFLGLIYIKTFNSITNEVDEFHLEGNPNDPDCDTNFVELWSEQEHAFFKRANKYHLNEGSVIRTDKKRPSKIKQSANNRPDKFLEALVSKPFMALKAEVEKMTTEAALLRVIQFAEDAQRPEKTMDYLRGRLSLIQSGELDNLK